MKKFMFLLLVIFIGCGTLVGQVGNTRPRTTISIAFAPGDLGIGLRIDETFGKMGVYVVATHGNYHLGEYYLHNHYKFSVGIIKYFETNTLSGHNRAFISIAPVYGIYGEHNFPDFLFNTDILKPWSLDLGYGIILGDVSIGFLYDFIKNDATLSIGFIFGG